jgi:surface antigen
LLYRLFFIFCLTGVFLSCKENFQNHQVGDVIDRHNGVAVYYNGSVRNINGRNLAPDGYNLGLKYQCVEFVKRYYYEYLHHKMPDTYGNAKDFFNESIADGEKNRQRDLLQYTNPSFSKPETDDLLIFKGNSFNPYGHVAIVSKVLEDQIEIVQQNPGPLSKSRARLNLKRRGNYWYIDDSQIIGWLRKDS